MNLTDRMPGAIDRRRLNDGTGLQGSHHLRDQSWPLERRNLFIQQLRLTEFGLMWLGLIGLHGSRDPLTGAAERYCAVKSMIGCPPSPATFHRISARIVDAWTVTFTSGGGSAAEWGR